MEHDLSTIETALQTLAHQAPDTADRALAALHRVRASMIARPILRVQTLGVEQLFLSGCRVDVSWMRAREVFYYLLAHPHGATPETLSEMIWPDLPPERSRGALRTAIYQLRAALPRELITTRNRQWYQINREAVVIEYDGEQFLKWVNAADHDRHALHQALALYRGPYLPYSGNEWSTGMRTLLERHYLRLLSTAADQSEHMFDYHQALDYYHRILSIDPLDEPATAGVMRCQMGLGNYAGAIWQYQAFQYHLFHQLGCSITTDSQVEMLYQMLIMSPHKSVAIV